VNKKQELFVQEYLVDLNATQAAIRAGYSKKTAGAVGHDLLKHPEIESALQKAMDRRSNKVGVTAERVLKELEVIAFSDISEVLSVDRFGRVLVNSLSELPPQTRRCIESIKQVTTEIPDGQGGTVEKVQLAVKLHSKVSALRMLMDHLGMDAPKKLEIDHELTSMSFGELIALAKGG
jgi:phage terminase small subunit